MTFVTRYIVFEKGKLQTVKQKQKIFDENHETWQLGIMKVPISILYCFSMLFLITPREIFCLLLLAYILAMLLFGYPSK